MAETKEMGVFGDTKTKPESTSPKTKPEFEYAETKMDNGLIHHVSKLGDFCYDPKIFGLEEVTTSSGRHATLLRYLGGSDDMVEIPDGIRVCTKMFEETTVRKVGNLPDSIKIATSMFRGCKSLVSVGDLPTEVEDAANMFSGCTSLTDFGSFGNVLVTTF